MKDTSKEEHAGEITTTLQQNLIELVRSKVFETFNRSPAWHHLQIESCEHAAGPWLSYIVVSGNALKMILKLQFSALDTRQILAAKLRKDLPSISDRMALDFMREQCNLIAGGIKAALHKKGISTGLSLPLVTQRFEETAVYESPSGTSSAMGAWKLGWDNGSVAVATVIHILKEQDLKAFSSKSAEEAEHEEDGLDGEFL